MWFRRVGRRFTREEACAAAGATMEQLRDLERLRLLVPTIPSWPPWGSHEPYYSESQVEVLRHLASFRRPDEAEGFA